MKHVAVVYWSGTGHTQAMAEAIAQAAHAELFTASDFAEGNVSAYDAIAFGCSAMGNEQLEDAEFAPMFEACKAQLSGKPVVLFGSYGWGDGEWMRTWEDDCRSAGAVLANESVICQDEPDEATLAACRALGEALSA